MRWEYKTVQFAAKGFLGGKLDSGQIEAHMNSLGAEGWELVTAFDTNYGQGATRDVLIIFKRPVES